METRLTVSVRNYIHAEELRRRLEALKVYSCVYTEGTGYSLEKADVSHIPRRQLLALLRDFADEKKIEINVRLALISERVLIPKQASAVTDPEADAAADRLLASRPGRNIRRPLTRTTK